jgi:hypothetical protein
MRGSFDLTSQKWNLPTLFIKHSKELLESHASRLSTMKKKAQCWVWISIIACRVPIFSVGLHHRVHILCRELFSAHCSCLRPLFYFCESRSVRWSRIQSPVYIPQVWAHCARTGLWWVHENFPIWQHRYRGRCGHVTHSARVATRVWTI